VAGPLGPIIQQCTKTYVRRRFPNVVALREKLYEVLREAISFSSQEEEEIVKLLQEKDQLTEQEWDRVFQQIDENDEKGRPNHAIFSALTTAQLEQLATEVICVARKGLCALCAWDVQLRLLRCDRDARGRLLQARRA